MDIRSTEDGTKIVFHFPALTIATSNGESTGQPEIVV
jgi:hypothetical protein